MSKYAPLSEYLAASGSQSVTLSFEEIEAVLGFPLPKSASYRAFWENSVHVQAKHGYPQDTLLRSILPNQ